MRVLAAAGMLSCAPMAAHAQLKPEAPTGSLLKRPPEKVPYREARFIIKGFAQCIFSRNRAVALKLLADSDPRAIDYGAVGVDSKKLGDELGMDDCLGTMMLGPDGEMGMKITVPALRNLLAEEAYLAANDKPLTIPEGGQEMVERSFVSAGDELVKAKGLAAFSDCITFNDVADSDGLLRTNPATKDEMSVIQKLVPALGGCLTAGQQLSLTPATIRSVIADGLWSRYHYGTKVVTPAEAAVTGAAKN